MELAYDGGNIPVMDKELLAGIIIMAVFQFAHMAVVVATSIKLVKQLVHRTASADFLVQSYLSTILLYAGVYTLLYRIDHRGWQGMGSAEPFTKSTHIIETFTIFLYFSTQTITSVGFGDIYPSHWYLYLLVTTQMLLGVVYSIAILGRGLEVIGSVTGSPGSIGYMADNDPQRSPGVPPYNGHTQQNQLYTEKNATSQATSNFDTGVARGDNHYE